MFRNNILLFLFILGWNLLPAQSASLDNLSDNLNAFEKHYVYPSVLRALLGQEDDTFNALIKDVQFVRILRLDSSMVWENDSILSTIGVNLESENFEMIADMFENGSSNEMYMLEKKEKIEGFIYYRKEQYSILIIEIVGELQLNNIKDLMNIDFDNFSMLLE